MNSKMVCPSIDPFASIWDLAKSRSDSSFNSRSPSSNLTGGCLGVDIDDEAGGLDGRGEGRGSGGRGSGVLK